MEVLPLMSAVLKFHSLFLRHRTIDVFGAIQEKQKMVVALVSYVCGALGWNLGQILCFGIQNTSLVT